MRLGVCVTGARCAGICQIGLNDMWADSEKVRVDFAEAVYNDGIDRRNPHRLQQPIVIHD